MVGFAFCLMSARFALGGFSVSFGFLSFSVGSVSMLEYGSAVAAILSVWLGREWVEKNAGDPAGPNVP